MGEESCFRASTVWLLSAMVVEMMVISLSPMASFGLGVIFEDNVVLIVEPSVRERVREEPERVETVAK